MLNWLKKWRTTEEERQQERITAYVDDALTAVEKRAFEQELAQDAALRQAVEAEQDLKVTLAQLPRLRAPRNFTLDTAVYAAQPRSTLALDWYPRLRTATAVVGFLLVGVLALNLLTPPMAGDTALPMMSQSQEVAVMQDEAVAPEALRVLPEAEAPAAASGAALAEEVVLESESEGEEGMGEADTTLFAVPEEQAAEMAEDEMAEMAEITAEEETMAADEALPTPFALPAMDASPVLTVTMTPLPTAVVLPPPTEPDPAPVSSSTPLDLWQISQLSLFVLFLALLTATLLTRRRL